MSIFDKFRGTEVAEPQSTDKNRIVGRIIKVSDRGFGFISSKSIPFTRIFFHWSALLQDTKNFADLSVGDTVEFETLKLPDKGYRAIRIKVLDSK